MDEIGDKITLRQMQIFLAAVESRSFIRAAEKLTLTPPAVSMQMRRLSCELGAPLFEKRGRSVRPTEAATALVPYAERLTETLREAVQVIETLQGKLDHLVRVAMVSTARNFGPQLVQHFQRTHPTAEIEISIGNRETIIGQLQYFKADIALMGRPPQRIEVNAHQFAKHPYVLICHPEHALANKRKIERCDLISERFIVRESGSGTRLVHEHFFREAGLSLPATQEMKSNANIKQAVMANLGIAFISAHTVALERQAGKLLFLEADGMPQLRDWYAVYPRGRALGSAALAFRDFVVSQGPHFMRSFFGNDFGAT